MEARKAGKDARGATVVAVEEVAERMRRLHLRLDAPSTFPLLPHTDSYVKVLIPPPDADDAWPVDPEGIRASRDMDPGPTRRTYTIRSLDAASGELSIDIHVHEGGGAAGPWVTALRPGAPVGLLGPGGTWCPDPAAAHLLLIGDGSALSAISVTLERMPEGASAEVFVEADDPSLRALIPDVPNVAVTWVDTAGSLPGSRLVLAVTSAHPRVGDAEVFLHGNAEMVRDLRRYLLGERGLDRAALSASGYWRHGCTDEEWRAQKKEFNARMEGDLGG